ncbi:MAG: PQQ-binding-like beta-propeller repeat protein [Persicimonas sp.]
MRLRRLLSNALLITAATGLVACGEATEQNQTEHVNVPEPEGIEALGAGEDSLDAVDITVIANGDQDLDGPRDVAINPEATDQLWVVNRNDNSVVVVFDPGTDEQTSERFNSMGSDHFLSKPAALAFGAPGVMATAQQEDEITQPSTPADFMGPSMWPTDLEHFDAGHGSHYDMLHNSPLASGIAWDKDNAYWVFDGHHGSITRYDFQDDHGMGGADHSDGIIHRYVEGQVSVVNGIVAHLEEDHSTGLLYIADTGNNRLAVLDTNTGEEGDAIAKNYDGATQHTMDDAEISTLVDGSDVGMAQPAGLALHDGHVYVGDNGSSTIYAFDLEGELVDSLDLSDRITPGGMMGLELDADGQIFVVDSEENAILRVSPKGE